MKIVAEAVLRCTREIPDNFTDEQVEEQSSRLCGDIELEISYIDTSFEVTYVNTDIVDVQ